MARTGSWMKILGNTGKQKVSVRIGEKIEQLTETQSYRFVELTETGDSKNDASTFNPLDDLRYGLEDAAFRLMISEDELLHRAAAGTIRLYADAAGLTGRWQRGRVDNDAVQSTERLLKSGFLALSVEACAELANKGRTRVTVLELHGSANPAGTNVDAETLQALSAWGQGNKLFCPRLPVEIVRNEVVLLAPLLVSGRR